MTTPESHPALSQERTVDEITRPCPDEAVLIVKGEAFPCDSMQQMHESSDSHEGWPHGSRAAEAIWR